MNPLQHFIKRDKHSKNDVWHKGKYIGDYIAERPCKKCKAPIGMFIDRNTGDEHGICTNDKCKEYHTLEEARR